MKPPKHDGPRKAIVTPENKAEAAKLLAIWNAKGIRGQAAFGEANEIGNQSAVGQFLRGDTPLSLKAAKGFSVGLGCSISDFSPRLAAISEWPFELVDRDRYEALSEFAKGAAQMRMMDEIETQERKQARGNGTDGP